MKLKAPITDCKFSPMVPLLSPDLLPPSETLDVGRPVGVLCVLRLVNGKREVQPGHGSQHPHPSEHSRGDPTQEKEVRGEYGRQPHSNSETQGWGGRKRRGIRRMRRLIILR
jgi:hypothetical protein